MSNLVFPTLSIPGFSISVTRSKLWKTNIQESVSGKEWRTSHWSESRDKLEFKYEFLRNAESWRELNRVFDFFAKHAGQWDSFLVEDPEDKLAVEQYLGSGLDDGVITDPPTAFQLQRVLRSSVEGARDGGETSGHPIFNLATASHRFYNNSAAPWTASIPWACTTGAGIQDFAGVAPDGTMTAARFSNGATADRNVGISHNALGQLRANQLAPAGAYSFSIWVRALSMEGAREVGLQFGGGGSGVDLYADPYVIFGDATYEEDPDAGPAAWRFTLTSTNWTRIGISINPKGGPNQVGDDPFTYGLFLGQPYSECLIWGAQLESHSQRFSKYVAAMDSTAEVYGIYGAGTEYGIAEPPITVWPGIADGSEPVHYARPCALEEFGERWPGVWGAGQYQPMGASYGASGIRPSASALDWQGKRLPHAGFLNFMRFSGDFSQSAAWTAAAAGSGSPVAPTFATIRATADSDLGHARGPDGSRDYGSAIVFDVGSGTTSATTSSITQTVDHPLLLQGESYTFSVWLFPWKSPTNDLPPIPLEIRENTSGSSVIAVLDRRRSIVDSRCWLTFTAGASCSITIRWRGDLAQGTSLTQVKVLAFGAQLERTTSSSPSWYLPTQAAAVMAAPEVRDNQPSIYIWDQGMHSFGTLLDPFPRINLSTATWSTGGTASPDNPTGDAAGGTTGGGSVGVGTSYASAIPAAGTSHRFTTGSMLCSSIYVRSTSTSTATTFTFGLRRDTPADITTNTIDFNPNNGAITRAGSRVVSAYAAPLPNRWFRLVMVSTWDNADTTQTPLAGATGASCSTYLHIVEPGRSVGSPFAGATWDGDYTILTAPSTNHPTAPPGLVLFPGDLDFQPTKDPPKLGQYFTWSGGFYKRCRFDNDEINAEQFVSQIWEIGSIPLITVKP